MGTLHYPGQTITIKDDRLADLEAAIISLLRAQRGLTEDPPVAIHIGATSLIIQPGIPISFTFDTPPNKRKDTGTGAMTWV